VRTVRDRRRALAVALLAVAPLTATMAGCSSTRDLGSEGETKTTIRKIADDAGDEGALAGGSQGAKEMQKIINRLLASNDPCAILTQKDVKGFSIDATALASATAREVLARGVIDVYDHLLDIVGDDAIKPALQKQRDTFVEILQIVDRYTANPTSKQGNDQIRALSTGPEFVKAQHDVDNWTYQHCT
jgi:hypothetical protein